MDIKPFVYDIDYWAVTGTAWIVSIICLVLFAVGLILSSKTRIWANILVLFSVMGMVVGMVFAGMLPAQARQDAYEAYVAEAQKTLEADGFTIISGTTSLRPNAQSDLLLEYKGKGFDCTMFSPKDVNRTVVFSCGEAKLSLEEVKNTVEGK